MVYVPVLSCKLQAISQINIERINHTIMDTAQQKPSWLYGALTGLLATPALMGVMFLGERVAGMPFVPFDLFNWIARVLPGGLITFGIDRMVDTLIFIGLGANLDSAAKTAEQLMALGIFWLIGIVATTAFFAIMNRVNVRAVDNIPGVFYGALFGLPFLLVVQRVNVSATASVFLWWVWLGLLFVGFGSIVNWAYDNLAFPLVDSADKDEKTKNASVEGIDRRQFIVRLGGATATLTVVGAGLGALFGTAQSSGGTPIASNDSGTSAGDGSFDPTASGDGLMPAPGTRQEITPVENHYRIDILAGGLPSIPDDYTLPITGLVANEVAWSLDEIRALPSVSEHITMSCISNRIAGSLISTTKWTGVPMQHILEQIEPMDEAAALRITGADDFDEYVSLDLIRNDERIMLCYAWDDAPLPLRNGYPLRIHIPDRYGMKQPKWIRTIEVVDEEGRGYWVRRGWSAMAIAKATSVIDTVAVDAIYDDEAGQHYVPVGGMAWAGDRDIVRVEISIDDGEWQTAQLRPRLSDRTWVLWRYDWPFEAGAHTFSVRMFEAPDDGQGDPILQPTNRSGVRPDGATGIHSLDERLSESLIESEAEPASES
jgi:DMSO/TMAO reductase YedYZ molybdopterin-dependent catalytic subunit